MGLLRTMKRLHLNSDAPGEGHEFHLPYNHCKGLGGCGKAERKRGELVELRSVA